MKSRKLGLFGKRRDARRSRKPERKETLRRGILETLEKREMLNADWNLDLAQQTGYYWDQEALDGTLAYLAERAGGGDSTGGSYGGEGADGDIVAVSEAEPNDGFNNAQHVPLLGNSGVNIAGRSLLSTDEDWYSFDLLAGDIVDMRLDIGAGAGVNLPMISLFESSSSELVTSGVGLPPGSLPDNSPLTGGGSSPIGPGDINTHYVVKEDGRYYARVSDVNSTYTLQLRRYRPSIEAEPVGTQQILFLDFDGAFLSRSLFGLGPGSARFSNTRSFLPGYGIQDADYDRFIDEIVSRVQSKFDTLGVNTTNPNYGIEIRNSKDHPDPWGLENVSRVVIGGNYQELVGDPTATNPGLLGIAESIDPGNFNREESAIVMHDVLVATAGSVPIDPFASRVEVIAELMSFVVVHEAGHFLGGWHQEPANNVLSIMDQFYAPIVSSGSGLDGRFGTADDAPIQFQADAFSTGGQPFFPGGNNDVVNWLGWGLSGGLAGGFVTGNTYTDTNFNRVLDGADTPLAGVQVYADLNGDGALTPGEFSTVSDAAGNYSLRVPEGSYTIREVVPSGYQLVSPADNALTVTVGLGATVAGQNFGQRLLNQEITGTKFNDVNGNGLRDAGEGGIEGVWFYIDADGDDRIDIGERSAQSGPDGSYKLLFDGPGTYTIREVIEPGYVQTLPGAALDFEYTITVTGNPDIDASVIAGLDFGNRLTVDFGDAPSSYGVASHGFTDGLILGANWDAEQGSQFSADATGDDLDATTDDEDGVTLTRPLVAGSTNNRVSVEAINSTGGPGFLNAWADYNHDGVFGAGEHIIMNASIGTGNTNVTFAAPAGAALGDTILRFRYSDAAGIGATGEAASGEVEDYLFTVVDSLNLAVDDSYTVARNSALNELPVLDNDFQLPGEALELVSVSGTAAGATVQISSNNTVLYTPPNGYIGPDTFTYTMRNSGGDVDMATVTVDVNLFFENPIAIDDSFDVSTNTVDFPLNVLANDIEGEDGALTIISVTQPDKGGNISIATGGKSLRYTPPREFGGTEFFTYTVADGGGNSTSAQVTLHTLPGDRADDDLLIQLVTTDASGTPITAIQQGQEFRLEMYVDDLRFDAVNPGVAAGVYAAYTDLLYNLQLVSTVPNNDPAARFSYEVDFFNDYNNFQTGDATVPGIIDEFGAFSQRTVMNENDPVLLAAITFSARSPGIADFMPDPADDRPLSDSLLFDTPGSPVPIERIRYLGTSIEIVGDGVEFPVAVDDSVPTAIPAGTVGFPIDVLANDQPGSTGQITLTSVSDGLFGLTSIDTRGTADPSDDRVLYTPNGGFNGADQFTYVIQDPRGIQSTATVTLRVGAADADDLVSLRLSATDLSGQPIDEIVVGNQFQLRGFVQDLRGFGSDRGIFAAYEDVLYSSTLVSPVASSTNDPDLGFEVTFGPNYQRVREGDIRTPGIINEIGAVQIENGNNPLGSDEQLLFIVTMTANSVGLADFIADPADISPLHDVLTFEPPAPVSFDKIRFGFDQLNIVAAAGGGSGEGFHNYLNAYDVNADGYVTPIDALGVINWLNDGGSRGLGGGAEGEEAGNKMYVDTNDDGNLSPIDALLVINHLNSRAGGIGEGEFAAMLSAGSLAESAGGVESESLTVDVQEEMGGNTIGVRLTGTEYGPGREDYVAATDDVFGEATDEEDLLNGLAPDIDETWKKKLTL